MVVYDSWRISIFCIHDEVNRNWFCIRKLCPDFISGAEQIRAKSRLVLYLYFSVVEERPKSIKMLLLFILTKFIAVEELLIEIFVAKRYK